MSTQDSRILIKRGTVAGDAPTVPPSNNHLDGTWTSKDIYKGEIYQNIKENRAYSRGDSGVFELTQKNVFVFDSSISITLGNTFKTWSELMTSVGRVEGIKWIILKSNLTINDSNKTLTDCILYGGQGVTLTIDTYYIDNVLAVEGNLTIAGTGALRLTGARDIFIRNSVTVGKIEIAGTNCNIHLRDRAIISNLNLGTGNTVTLFRYDQRSTPILSGDATGFTNTEVGAGSVTVASLTEHKELTTTSNVAVPGRLATIFERATWHLTSLTGVGTSSTLYDATSLDQVPTTGSFAVPSSVIFRVVTGNKSYNYKLESGTATEASPTIILPNDYNAVSNAKYWRIIPEYGGQGVIQSDNALTAHTGTTATTFLKFYTGTAGEFIGNELITITAWYRVVSGTGSNTASIRAIGGLHTLSSTSISSGNGSLSANILVRPNPADGFWFAGTTSSGNNTTNLTTNAIGIDFVIGLAAAGNVMNVEGWNIVLRR